MRQPQAILACSCFPWNITPRFLYDFFLSFLGWCYKRQSKMLYWFQLGLDVLFWLLNWYIHIFSLFENIHFAFSCIYLSENYSYTNSYYFYLYMYTCLPFLVFVSILYFTEMGFWKSVHLVLITSMKQGICEQKGCLNTSYQRNVNMEKWKWFCLDTKERVSLKFQNYQWPQTIYEGGHVFFRQCF